MVRSTGAADQPRADKRGSTVNEEIVEFIQIIKKYQKNITSKV